MKQLGCPMDCARALDDRAVSCRIALGRAVGAVLVTIRGC